MELNYHGLMGHFKWVGIGAVAGSHFKVYMQANNVPTIVTSPSG